MLADFFLAVSGSVFVAVGFLYLAQPERIFKLHAWIRELVLNDAYISLRRKKIGSILIIIGLILLTSVLRG